MLCKLRINYAEIKQKKYAEIMQESSKNYAKNMQKLCNVPGMHYYA